MRRHTVTLAALLPVLVALTACAAPPTATPPTPSTSASPPPPADNRPRLPIPTSLGPPKVDLPPRPYEIRLDGRNPCAVLTPDQQRSSGLDLEPRHLEIDAYNYAPSCLFGDSRRDWDTTVSFATEIGGIETFTRSDLYQVDLQPTTIAGFPAVFLRSDRTPFTCDIVIDIAPAQVVVVGVSDTTVERRASRDEFCLQATQEAAAVMTTLQAA